MTHDGISEIKTPQQSRRQLAAKQVSAKYCWKCFGQISTSAKNNFITDRKWQKL